MAAPSLSSLSTVLMPPTEVLAQGDDAEARLQKRRRAQAGGRLGILLSVLLWFLASVAQGHAPKLDLSHNWPFLVAALFGVGSLLSIAWARYFIRGAREPFRYTYTVDPFTPI